MTVPKDEQTSSRAKIAEIVHDAMVWAAQQTGQPKPWQNGNSYAEDRAREAVRAIEATRPAAATDELVERVAETIADFLDERFPDGAMPGGQQLFATDHLDAEFKHEAGCDALARAILAAIEVDPVVKELVEALTALRTDLEYGMQPSQVRGLDLHVSAALGRIDAALARTGVTLNG